MTAKKKDFDNQPAPEETAKMAQEASEIEARAAEVEQRISAAEERVKAAEQKTGELNERLLRLAAEYENHRKRSQKEHDNAFNNGVCFSANQLLPIIDTLGMAAGAESTDEEYKKGVLLTLSKCEEVFAKLGITEIEAQGQPFDPAFHDACMQQPAEGAESGTVTAVIQKGYKMGDKVIRHAVVAVAP